jgi:hypothetical protein
MAKMLRQQPTYLYMIEKREVDDINPVWTTSLRDSMSEFTDIIKEPGGLRPSRKCNFAISLEWDEPPKEQTYRGTVCHRQKSERLMYNCKTSSLRAGFVRLNLRTVPRFYLYARRMVPCVCA